MRVSTIIITIVFLWMWSCVDFNPWTFLCFSFYMLIRYACHGAEELQRQQRQREFQKWKEDFNRKYGHSADTNQSQEKK